MINVGEEITGAYLSVIKGCDFVQYNLYTPDVQGEIDVVGVNRRERVVYVCEVAIHLVTGLQYVDAATRKTDNVPRIVRKFEKDIDYAEKYFEDHDRVFMLWSPIITNPKRAQHNQTRDVTEIARILKQRRGIDLELIINERYRKALNELRAYAGSRTEALKSPILRFLQIEERLSKHLERLKA